MDGIVLLANECIKEITIISAKIKQFIKNNNSMGCCHGNHLEIRDIEVIMLSSLNLCFGGTFVVNLCLKTVVWIKVFKLRYSDTFSKIL